MRTDSAATEAYILFVSELSENSRIAVANVGRMLAALGKPADCVEIIDVGEQFERALELRVMVTPTLLRRDNPKTRLTGDLSARIQLEQFLR